MWSVYAIIKGWAEEYKIEKKLFISAILNAKKRIELSREKETSDWLKN